ncbi:unnamed protein product, partial [Staurois parvus]
MIPYCPGAPSVVSLPLVRSMVWGAMYFPTQVGEDCMVNNYTE